MKKFLKSAISLLLIFVFAFSFLCINTFAAGANISFSSSNVSVGDTVTVNVTLDPGEATYGVSCDVNYDSSILEYKSGNASGGAGYLKIVESPQGETKVSYALTFTALVSGNCNISVANCVYTVMDPVKGSIEKSLTGSSSSVSVKDVTLSSNANLKSLKLSQGKLSPSFSANKLEYTVNVKNSIVECAVYAVAAESGANVNVSGNNALVIGKNTRTVTVTAPDGVSKKVYTINIIRSETDDEIDSSDTESTVETPVTGGLATNVDGMDYSVLADLTGVTLFGGFEVAEATFNGETVQVAKDVNNYYTLYYLKSAVGEEIAPYTYDESLNVFTKLPYFTQGENVYIFADKPIDIVLPEEYYNTNFEISSFNIRAFANGNSGMSDFYYVYCYSNGSYGFYRYDSRDNVLQRYPELSISELMVSADEDDSEQSDDFINRFDSLSGNAKIIVVGFILLVFLVIALIILVVIKLVRRRYEISYDEDYINSLDFDDVSLDDSFLITDEEIEIEELDEIEDSEEIEQK